MAQSRGNLNGSGPFFVLIDVWYSGVQDWNANTSRFDWAVYIGCDSNGWGTFGIGGSWSVSIGGIGYSGGLPNPDFRPAGSSNRLIAVATGSTWHGHDGNGYRGGFASSAWIDSNHGSVGDGGSGEAWVDAPRIPITPGAPNTLGFDQIQPTTMQYRFSGTHDGGSSILEWQAQIARNAAFTDSVQTVSSSGTTTFGGLRPGTVYYARSRGRNVRGWGGWSGTSSAKTLSGAYVWTGTEWLPGEVLYWDNGWKTGEVYYWNGTAWTLAS